MLFNRKLFWEYLWVTAGSFVVAAGLVFFLIPHKIAAGGVSGMAIIIYHLVGLPVGLTMLALNVPLFLIAIRKIGLNFGIKTLWGTITLSFFTDILNLRLDKLTNDPLLASIYGGILVGVGLGIVFRARATTGGSDLAAQLLYRRIKGSTGQALLAIDGSVIIIAGIVFNIELALYGLIGLMVSSRLIDVIQEGLGYEKAALIISSRNDEISREILTGLSRGVTALKGTGLYTGQSRNVLLTVVSRSEVTSLKKMVSRIDPHAFVIITNVQEALGEGFKTIAAEGSK